MPSWGISRFHFWLNNILLEPDTRGRLSHEAALEDAALPAHCLLSCSAGKFAQPYIPERGCGGAEGQQECSDHGGMAALSGICSRAARPRARAS